VRHCVIVRVSRQDPVFSIYTIWGKPLQFENHTGDAFLLVAGDDLHPDGRFWRIRLIEPKVHRGLTIRIPDHLIVACFSDEKRRPMGFLDA
jgi:hypothetical protein